MADSGLHVMTAHVWADARTQIVRSSRLSHRTVLVPRLSHNGIDIWDTLAIAAYLAETFPEHPQLPDDQRARALCRSIAGEMHSGFYNLRSALPMNLKAHYPGFKVWTGAQADIARVISIWTQCLETSGGPFLFGVPTLADAMYAPVCTRFLTYDVKLDARSTAYCDHIMTWSPMAEWAAAARNEPDELEELDVEF